MNLKVLKIIFCFIIFLITFTTSESLAESDSELIKNKIVLSTDNMYFYNYITDTIETIENIQLYDFVDISQKLNIVKSELNWYDFVNNLTEKKSSDEIEFRPYEFFEKKIDLNYYNTIRDELLNQNQIDSKTDFFIVQPIKKHFYAIFYVIKSSLKKSFCFNTHYYFQICEPKNIEDQLPYELKYFNKLSDCEGLIITNFFDKKIKTNTFFTGIIGENTNENYISYKKKIINTSEYYFVDNIDLKFIKNNFIETYFNKIILSDIFLQFIIYNNDWELSFKSNEKYKDIFNDLNSSKYLFIYDEFIFNNFFNFNFIKIINKFISCTNKQDYDYIFFTPLFNDIIKLYRINNRNIKIYYLLKKSTYLPINFNDFKNFIRDNFEYINISNNIKIKNIDIINFFSKNKNKNIMHNIPKNDLLNFLIQYLSR